MKKKITIQMCRRQRDVKGRMQREGDNKICTRKGWKGRRNWEKIILRELRDQVVVVEEVNGTGGCEEKCKTGQG